MKKDKEKQKKPYCKNCGHYKIDGHCQLEGPTLFLILFNRYLSIGFTKEEAGKKSWFQCEVPLKHTCKQWRKRTDNQPKVPKGEKG